MNECELTILMPCLNEAETLANCIYKAKNFLQENQIEGEILIADNNSTDGSQRIAEDTGVQLIRVMEKGYGAALIAGIQAAKGRYIIMGDADNSYNFSLLLPFLNKLRQGYDLVMGNRFHGGIMSGAMPFLNRYLGNPVLSFLGRVLFRTAIGDFHCGLRGFNRERLLQLNLNGKGMEFASEMVVKASLHRYKITEVPTPLFPDGRSRKPHLRPWRDGWRHLRLLLLLCPRWLFFYPGMLLFTLGTLILLILARGQFNFGNLAFDIHTMLFASLFIIVGLQGVAFAFFTDQIARFNLGLPATRYSQWLNMITFERGLVIGCFFIGIGSIGSIFTFWTWQKEAFGPLLPSQSMRILIPSITAFIVGTQCLFTSFFLSVLKLHKIN